MFVCLFVFLFFCLFVCLFVCLFAIVIVVVVFVVVVFVVVVAVVVVWKNYFMRNLAPVLIVFFFSASDRYVHRLAESPSHGFHKPIEEPFAHVSKTTGNCPFCFCYKPNFFCLFFVCFFLGLFHKCFFFFFPCLFLSLQQLSQDVNCSKMDSLELEVGCSITGVKLFFSPNKISFPFTTRSTRICYLPSLIPRSAFSWKECVALKMMHRSKARQSTRTLHSSRRCVTD